jgi:hypothetical protein
MGLKVTESKPFVTDIPEDTYSAVCVGVFDLGTVHNEKFNKDDHNVMFLWELIGVSDNEGQPKTIQQQYTASLGEKANLRKMLTNWRGRAFNTQELENFDVRVLLGKPCQLLVIHNESKGNVYANIQNVSGWPKGVPAPKRRLPLLTFEFGVNVVIPDRTPEWIERKIMSAPEWADREALASGAPATSEDFGNAPVTAPAASSAIDNDDEVPF